LEPRRALAAGGGGTQARGLSDSPVPIRSGVNVEVALVVHPVMEHPYDQDA
jgi:hypothetical protein